ncbi:MAG: hypothetical protein GY847_31605 [Proteobacteria bacterium]|nr:hypothetical protein [Pseudomonadota bacterium]
MSNESLSDRSNGDEDIDLDDETDTGDDSEPDYQIDQTHLNSISSKGYDPWPEPDPNQKGLKLVTVDIDPTEDLFDIDQMAMVQIERGWEAHLDLDDDDYLVGRVLVHAGEILSFAFPFRNTDKSGDHTVTVVVDIDAKDSTTNEVKVRCSPDCRFGIRIPDVPVDEIDLGITVIDR